MTNLQKIWHAEHKARLLRLSRPLNLEIVPPPPPLVYPVIPETETPTPLTVRAIIDGVAQHYHISRTDLLSQRRTRDVLIPRQVACHLAANFTHLSLPAIGRLLGGRDHTTIIHANRKIAALADDNPRFSAELQGIVRAISGATTPTNNVAELIALVRPALRLWTDEETTILQDMSAAGFYPSRIGRRLRRSASSIRTKGRQLGLVWIKKRQMKAASQ